jgi:hypothetical protein
MPLWRGCDLIRYGGALLWPHWRRNRAHHEKDVDKGKSWERRGRFTDTWIFLNGKWQCVASHFSVKPK